MIASAAAATRRLRAGATFISCPAPCHVCRAAQPSCPPRGMSGAGVPTYHVMLGVATKGRGPATFYLIIYGIVVSQNEDDAAETL